MGQVCELCTDVTMGNIDNRRREVWRSLEDDEIVFQRKIARRVDFGHSIKEISGGGKGKWPENRGERCMV